MALIEWRQEFNTGIPAVDHEHQQLIEIINDLYEKLRVADAEAVTAFLAELHDRVSAHFALEERIMQERLYEGYVEHKTDHERLLDDIRDVMEEYRSGGYRDAADRLALRLEEWFSRHFRTLDVRFHKWVASTGASP